MALAAARPAERSDRFETYTHKWATDLLRKRYTQPMKSNRAFFEGNHWQKGAGWLGPKPDPNQKDAQEVLKLIEDNFISKNVLREVVQRHTSAVVGREIAWKFVRTDGEDPTEEDKARIAELESTITEWWDERNVAEDFQGAVDTLLWAERSVLRLFVPGRFLDSEGNLARATFEEAVRYLYLDTPTPDMATVFEDIDAGDTIGIYAWTDEESNDTIVELAFLNENGQLVIRQLEKDGGAPDDSTPIDTDGKLSLYEMRRSEYITEQARKNQQLVNMAITMMSRNVVLGGFLERTIINAEMPGHYETDQNTGQKKFIPEPLKVGAGTTTLLQGITSEDETGRRQIAPVSVNYRDPVSVATFEETKQSAQENIYDETKQRHILIAGDATASGISRQQATADFETDVGRTKVIVDRAAAWLLDMVKQLAGTFSGTAERYAGYRAVVDTRVRVSPPTPDEQRIAMELRDGQIIATETAMNRAGVEDVEAEQQKIEQEREEAIDRARDRNPREPGALNPEDDQNPDEDEGNQGEGE